MKKNLLFLCLLFAGLFSPAFVNAQTDAKTSRGGTIFGSGDIRFEMVKTEKGELAYYPVNAEGKTPEVMPTSADITVTYVDLRRTDSFKAVPLTEGCFKVKPNSDIPVYVTSVIAQVGDQTIEAKHRNSELQAK